ncbi:hypothetical protein AZE42_11076 [Rhizopogon vesiculosus]|uniref:6S proteasome subunit Rpn6 C-terminal helix domain-containing protein n=1 Tax=Rhizopogon vesiculosus TaxID=180088 RepID=A0A1J8QI12_9AGAM|nr:hypothetical protein AZE42_11076 [Rhizopogon vesiculosus]
MPMSQKPTYVSSCTSDPIFCSSLFQNTYGVAIGTLGQVSEVVDSLYAKNTLPFARILQCYTTPSSSGSYDVSLSRTITVLKRLKNGAQADAEDMKDDGNDDIDTRYDGYPNTEGNSDGNRNGYFVQDGSTTIPAAAPSCQDILVSDSRQCQPQ